MGDLEGFLGCVIRRDLTDINLNVSQTDIINKMNQGFKGYLKSLMTFNAPATPYKGSLSNQETDTKISYHIHKSYRSGIGYLLYLVKH